VLVLALGLVGFAVPTAEGYTAELAF
jgi:hypothetical protein